MSGIWKNDIYRLLKSPVFFVSMAFSFVLPFALTMILHQDINIGIGISGFNEPTIIIFREMQDIIRMGIQYHTALGVFVAIVGFSEWLNNSPFSNKLPKNDKLSMLCTINGQL